MVVVPHTIRASVFVAAPIERCFLLSTDVGTVRQTLGLRPVEGRTEGHVVLGDRVVWRGWKFMLPQIHRTLITGYAYPYFFQDTQEFGRFASFQHDHRFSATGDGTCLEDEVRFLLPFGPAGRLVARIILIPHVESLLRRRFSLLKQLAETEGWRSVLGG
jgi:ligand-binding SRPBCC domain-containing protein